MSLQRVCSCWRNGCVATNDRSHQGLCAEAVRWRSAVPIGSVGHGCLTIIKNEFRKRLAAGAGSFKSANRAYITLKLPIGWCGQNGGAEKRGRTTWLKDVASAKAVSLSRTRGSGYFERPLVTVRRKCSPTVARDPLSGSDQLRPKSARDHLTR